MRPIRVHRMTRLRKALRNLREAHAARDEAERDGPVTTLEAVRKYYDPVWDAEVRAGAEFDAVKPGPGWKAIQLDGRLVLRVPDDAGVCADVLEIENFELEVA